MRIFMASLLCVLASNVAAPAQAADIASTSAIDAVTVFPSGAEITRVAHVALTAGEQTVVLRDLPARLIDESLRVQGQAPGKVEIGSVDTRRFFPSEDETAKTGADRKKLQDDIQALQDKVKSIDAATAGVRVQVQLIDNLAKLPLRSTPAAGAAPADPDWGQLFTVIGARLAEANKAIADNEIAKRDTVKQIEELQRQLNQQPQPQDQRTEVIVHVTTAAPLEADLQVRYQVPAADWTPIYDARLETGDSGTAPKLSLIRRAIVRQQTGEAWDGVKLTLSTTRPGAGTVAPELYPLSVDFGPVAVAASLQRQEMRSMAKALPAGQANQAVDAVKDMPAPAPENAPAAPILVQQTAATAINTTFQALYVIADRQSIKSGVGDKRVEIDIKAFEPALSVRAVPKFSETAYLYAKYKLDADSLVLPGQVALFRDGVFAGTGALNQGIGGEEQELGFGADDKVRIKFANLGRTAGQTGLISTSKTDTRSFKMTVKNLHARPIDLRVLDQLPVSLNDQIRVDTLSDTTPPTKRDVDDKKGLLAWDLKLAAGQAADLAFGYQVSWPDGQAVSYEQHQDGWAPQKK